VTGAHGQILWLEGAAGLRRRAGAMHFVAGADWSEARAGTNAPGPRCGPAGACRSSVPSTWCVRSPRGAARRSRSTTPAPGPCSAHAAFGGYKSSGTGCENHLMMLDHDQQTTNLLVSYNPSKLGFF